MANYQNIRNLRHIFHKAVESVRPEKLLSAANNYHLTPTQSEGADSRSTIKLQGKHLDVTNKRCHVVGFGKAVLGMAVQLERALGDQLVSGILSIPTGSLRQFRGVHGMQLSASTCIKVIEGAPNNQPDNNALRAAQAIKQLANRMTYRDILFVLISGGGSALLPLPRTLIELDEKTELAKMLANRGAAIDELNLVRIALSDIKGGKLAAAASDAAAVISFVISDIVGDPIDLIASGPTCATSASGSNAKLVLQKYGLWDTVPAHIRALIETSAVGADEKPGANNAIYIVGNNRIATATAAQEARCCGYTPFIASTTVQGEVQDLAAMYVDFLKAIYCFREKRIDLAVLRQRFPYDDDKFQQFLEVLNVSEKTGQPLLIIMAGEPTVKVSGTGLGGRNQELALRMSFKFHENPELANVSFLSAGTDGIDGPTPAAGAIGSGLVISDYLAQAGNTMQTAAAFLTNNDSYTFYRNLCEGQYHVVTGHTGTNVMDLHLLLLA